MKDEEIVAAEKLIRAMVADVKIADALEGHVTIKTIVCPYCQTQSADYAAATKHDGECIAHPMAVKAEQYRLALEKAEGLLTLRTESNVDLIARLAQAEIETARLRDMRDKALTLFARLGTRRNIISAKLTGEKTR